MASNTYSVVLGTQYYLDLTINETNNVSSNTSTITWVASMRLTNSGNYYNYNGGNSLYVALGGNVLINTSNVHAINISGPVSHTLASGTWTYSHNADGTGAFSVVCTFRQTQSSKYNSTISTTHTCTTIPRASTFTASSTTLGGTMTITINRPSSNFTHKVTATCGSSTTVLATNATTSASWQTSVSWASLSTSSGTVTGTITVETFNGSTKIGTTTGSVAMTIPASIKPSVTSMTYAEGDTTAVPADPFDGLFIQTKSKLAVTAVASTADDYGATISAASVSVGGTSYSANVARSGTTYTITALTGTLPTAGNVAVTVTVTDTRGRTASQSVTVTVTAYSAPTISSMAAVRCSSNGTPDEAGIYAKVTASAGYSSISGLNTYSARISYSGGSSGSATISDTAISHIFSDISGDYAYTFTLRVSDFWTTVSATATVAMSFKTLDFKAGGKGIGVGKTSTKDGLDIDMDVWVHDMPVELIPRFVLKTVSLDVPATSGATVRALTAAQIESSMPSTCSTFIGAIPNYTSYGDQAIISFARYNNGGDLYAEIYNKYSTQLSFTIGYYLIYI